MAKAKETPIVTVRGTGSDNKVVLWERNKAHPNGEVFLSNDGKARQVALTPAIKTRLREGRLEEADAETETATSEASQPSTGNGQEGNSAPKVEAPWVGFDKQSVDEVLKELEGSDEETRGKVLAYERAKGARGRKTIIDKLVNWNNGAS